MKAEIKIKLLGMAKLTGTAAFGIVGSGIKDFLIKYPLYQRITNGEAEIEKEDITKRTHRDIEKIISFDTSRIIVLKEPFYSAWLKATNDIAFFSTNSMFFAWMVEDKKQRYELFNDIKEAYLNE